MDIKQAQKEMERIQAEIMKLQMEYAANPTPESAMIMQQKITILSQEALKVSAMSSSDDDNEVNIYADDFYVVDEQAIKDFVAAHPVPEDQKKYLLIGGILIATHDEPWQCFALMEEAGYWQSVLDGGWGIGKVAAGRKMLASLLEGRHEARYGNDYRKFKAGQPHKLDEDGVEGYEDTLESLKEDSPSLIPYAQKCNTLLAWDLERVGYLARIFRGLGWIDDAEMLDWIKKAAKAIKDNFSVWEEYVVSILIGRAVAYNFDYSVVGTAQEVLDGAKDILKKYPISSL